MDSAIPSPLPVSGTIDLRTIGRRSGESRWMETWYVSVEGATLLTGTPGPRDWLANLAVHPEVVVRFREPEQEVGLTARVVRDRAERRRLVPLIWAAQPWYADQGYSIDEWVAASPMAVLTGAA